MDKKAIKANAANLAVTKALIGIVELSLMERVKTDCGYASLSSSKAIMTYYVVYHLLVSHMTRLKKDDEIKQGAVDLGKLNSTSITPSAWNESTIIEKDEACCITHKEIKKFLNDARKSEVVGDAFAVLYEYFIGDEYGSAPYLYEKLCYIRDRTVYRPSFVYDQADKTYQTSWQVKEEIASLPSSEVLYNIIKEYAYKLFREEEVVYCLIQNCGNTKEYWESIGITEEVREQFIKENMLNGNEATAFVAHLLELESPETVINAYKMYYKPFEDFVFQNTSIK